MWRRCLIRQVGQLNGGSHTGKALRSTAVCQPTLQPATRTRLFTCNTDGQRWTDFGIQQVRYSHMSTTVERGAYDERFYQHVKGSDVKNVELVSDGRLVSITWGDGKVSRFHSVWLRSSCFCPNCRISNSGQSKPDYEKLPGLSHILSAEDDGEGCLVVQWKDEPGHTGIFPLKFLKANCYTKESLENKRNSCRMTFSKDNVIPRVQYEEVINSNLGVYKWVKALNETGITIMEGVPCEDGMSKKLCQRIADQIQNTVYGETFDVKSVGRPINAAYSSGGLGLHMDLPMYEGMPGLQALHCIKFDEKIVGGENEFVDVFHVAETFRERHPDDFDLLCKVPAAYETVHYQRSWPVHMCYRRPVFTVNKYGDLIGAAWHPFLTGPLQVEEELVEPFFQAFGRLASMINNFPYRLRHRLREGEMVTFNNRRMMHGRTAFSNESGGERVLQGCYVNISEFKSCVQVLSNLVGDGRPPVRVGDCDQL